MFKRLHVVFLAGLLTVFGFGCASLDFKSADVLFDDPIAKLGIQPLEANAQELVGVELSQLPSYQTPLQYHEDNTLFARVEGGRGVQMKFSMNRKDLFRPGSRPETYVVMSETIFEKDGDRLGRAASPSAGGTLLEEKELTIKDEIVKFIRGRHDSQIGKFEITSWTRTPSLPSKPVKVGDTWSYEEKMNVKMKSFWIKQVDPKPYEMKAASRLEGFAKIRNVRCAVIKTTAKQMKREHLKVFFKNLQFQIQVNSQTTTYWDYQSGRMMAQITKTESQTQGINLPINDSGQSQSVIHLLAS